jgi:Transposase IS4
MKAVVNAVIKSDLWRGSNDVNGYRVVSLDNRYQCPQLAHLLWTRYHVLLVGTCRQNRIGWPKDVMDLDRTKPKPARGTFKMAYCDEANIAAFQWCDSKVVNCISSYCDFGVSTVQRQLGSERVELQCPSTMVYYQKHMGGVDKMDQMRSHFGGFASQSHFKKWYKKSLMAVLDCMLLNGLKMWNMSAKKVKGREELARFRFIHVVAEELLRYNTPELCSPEQPRKRQQGAQTMQMGGIVDDLLRTHKCPGPDEVTKTKAANKRCLVCGLEVHCFARGTMMLSSKKSDETGNAEADVGKPPGKKARYEGLRKSVYTCNICGISAHYTALDPAKKRAIHNLFPPGDATSCMAIAHSKVGREIWCVNVDGKGEKKISVKNSHPIVKEMRRCVEATLAAEDEELQATNEVELM